MGTTRRMSGEKTINNGFIDACKAEEVEKVKAAITLGCDVNYGEYMHSNRTGLMNSAGLYFNLEIMNLLLQQPAIDVNKAEDGGATALMWASYCNKHLAVERLGTVQGLEVNRKTPDGWTTTGGETALHKAAGNNSVESLQALLTIPGIDVNIKNKAGDTPIVLAYKNNKKDAFKVLVAADGVDLTLKDKDGKTLEDLARDRTDRETLALIPGAMEHQVGVLTQTVRNLQMRTAPECPVCYNEVKHPQRLFQC